MLKLLIISFFTGTGQLFAIWVLKYLSQHGAGIQLTSIGQVDSIVMLLTTVIAMGLQSAAVRDLATTDQWRKEFGKIQSARVSMGLVLLAGSALSFINPYYLVFFIAPLLSWSGDYALYARGHAVSGSIIAFIRSLFPFSAVLLASGHSDYLWLVYAIAMAAVYILTNLFIAFILKTPYFSVPKFRYLRLYLSSLPLGVVVLSMYFIGLGLMLVIPYFYVDRVIATAFVGLKFYIIIKGVLRIVHQAFIKEMVDYEVCFKVDQLTSLIGIAFAGFVAAFPQTFTNLFFGETYLDDQKFFILLGMAAFIYSLFSSLITKAMLEKKDKPYAVLSLVAATVTVITTVALSYFIPSPEGIGISLVVGETLFAVSLVSLMKRPKLVKERAVFFVKNIPLMVLPFLVRYIGSDKMMYLIIASIVYALLAAVLYYKTFSTFAAK